MVVYSGRRCFDVASAREVQEQEPDDQKEMIVGQDVASQAL